jgi:hypothetical protein
MSTNFDFPILQRPAFFDGQRLTADDLDTVQTFHRELRWLHNRSLHNWGIAFGYTVTGVRKQRTVQVQPGYALDCKGRELVLTTAMTLPIPPVAGASDGGPATYYLTVSYAEDADLTAETRTGVCGTSGAVRRPERPIIRWQDPNDRSAESGYRYGLDIVLASIQVLNCQLATDVSGVERRDAVPAQQPYIAAGQTIAGKTLWRLWPDAETPVGVMTTVTTTAAGFRTTPRYQAHVLGTRVFERTDDEVTQDVVVDGYAQLTQVTAASFDLIVILPQGIIASTENSSVVLNPNLVLTEAFMNRLRDDKDLAWTVVWMGIEG